MKTKPKPKDDPQSEIPLWAGRYARNRVLPILLWMVGVLLLITLQGLASILLMHSHSTAMYIVSIFMNVAITLTLFWAIITGRNTRWFKRLSSKLYENEGVVVPALPTPTPVHSKLKTYLIMGSLLVGPWLLLYVLTHVLGVPPRYFQPAIAVVIVPLISWGVLAGAETPKWPGLLMPVLYGIHAVLVLAGVPVPAFGVSYLDAFIPLFVYSVISLMVMHFYSRYALLKLQIAVLTPQESLDNAEEESVYSSGGHDDD